MFSLALIFNIFKVNRFGQSFNNIFYCYSLRLSWSRSVNADGASIKILPQNSDEVLRSFKVSANTVIITDLEAASYTIEVR